MLKLQDLIPQPPSNILPATTSKDSLSWTPPSTSPTSAPPPLPAPTTTNPSTKQQWSEVSDNLCWPMRRTRMYLWSLPIKTRYMLTSMSTLLLGTIPRVHPWPSRTPSGWHSQPVPLHPLDACSSLKSEHPKKSSPSSHPRMQSAL